MEIKDEDDLKVYLGRMEKSYLVDVYPEVKLVARKIQVTPDIDLLKIDSSHNIITGYETKYLKFHGGWKRFSYEVIYQGLGQALLYLNYGIEDIYLVIAYETADVTVEAIKKLLMKFGDLRRSLLITRLASFLGLRTIKLENGIVREDKDCLRIRKDTFLELTKLPNYVIKNRVFIRACFFEGEFNWNNKLYNNIHS